MSLTIRAPRPLTIREGAREYNAFLITMFFLVHMIKITLIGNVVPKHFYSSALKRIEYNPKKKKKTNIEINISGVMNKNCLRYNQCYTL